MPESDGTSYTYCVTDSKHKQHTVVLREWVPNAEFLDEGTKEWADAASVLCTAIDGIAVDWEEETENV